MSSLTIIFISLKLTVPHNLTRMGITKTVTKKVTILLEVIPMTMTAISELFPLVTKTINSLINFIFK